MSIWKGDGSAKDIRVGLTPEQKARREHWEAEIKKRQAENPGKTFWTGNEFGSWGQSFRGNIMIAFYLFLVFEGLSFLALGPRDWFNWQYYVFTGVDRRKLKYKESETKKD